MNQLSTSFQVRADAGVVARFLAALAIAIAALVPAITGAREAAPLAENPVLEQRLMNVAKEMRCLVCQNQTLADSSAELAADLRDEIRVQMEHGASDREVVEYLVARYGDFVLYRPPFKAKTLLLWTGPALLLLLGVGLLSRNLAQRRRRPTEPPLSDGARARVLELIGDDAQMGDRA